MSPPPMLAAGGGAGELAAQIDHLPLPVLGAGVGEEEEEEEDRLSALPDDIVVSILLRLGSTPAAARTSVLSRRWRHLWAHLPEIRFPFPSNPTAIAPALSIASTSAPSLRLVHVACRDADAHAADAWLRLAASHLAPGGVVYFHNTTPWEEEQEEEEEALAWQCPTYELPCFATAAKLWLRLGFVDLELPPAGVFAHLTEMRLEHVSFSSGHMLGYVLSATRCPALRHLRVAMARGLATMHIYSESLVRLELEIVNGLEELVVFAPRLTALNVRACFVGKDPVACVQAPTLEFLWWSDAFDPSSVLFSEMPRLQHLTTFTIPVYGRLDYTLLEDYAMLLQRFPAVFQLDLVLNYERDLDQYAYLMDIVTTLPDVYLLSLWLYTKGHSIGTSVFHLLTVCPDVRKLKLTLLDDFKVDIPCGASCACDQHPDWDTMDTVLGCLREVEILNFRGEEDDLVFVSLLFLISPVILKMTITLHHLVNASEELFHRIHGLAPEGTWLEIHQNTSEVSYKPRSSLFPKSPDDDCD